MLFLCLSLMPMSPSHYANVLKFWRAVETFTLPDLPKVYNELKPGKPFPWDPGVLEALEEGKQWKHTLYFHVVSREEVIDLLARLSGSKEFRDPVDGLTSLSAVVLDRMGQPGERSYSPSAFMYGIKIIQEKMSPDVLTDLLKKAQEDYLTRFHLTPAQDGTAVPKIVDWPVLQKELDHLRGVSGHALTVQYPVVCVSEPTARAGIEVPFLNSYYVDDLNTLLNNIQDIGEPMKAYLAPQPDMGARYDLLDRRALLEGMHPRGQSPGRWPSDPTAGLYSAQQAALYLAMSGLRRDSPIAGINGPPGTGKTTLLREAIADIVVGRGQRILKAKNITLFSWRRKMITEKMGYYAIDPSVFGNDGIVVASNNNTAIENISKELPTFKSIAYAHFKDEEYFSGIASNIYEEPCWGMMSAVLGRSINRSSFVSKFWFGKEHSFRKLLKEQYDDPALYSSNRASYNKTAEELMVLLKEYEVFHALASEHHELLLKILFKGGGSRGRLQELASELKAGYDLGLEDMPGMDFMDLSLEKIHRLTLYSSVKINTLRSNIFLRSLELHEWAIKVNAQYFSSNLNAFVNMLSNSYTNFIDEHIAATLWNTFFFCVPVVSVTLASFHRQFPKMGGGSIGWLLLDEAGQATPASACGAIWRCKRCIIIGDTLQIPPVVTIPAALGRLLQDNYGIKDDCWSPVHHSAQYLADRVTAAGTYVDGGSDINTWTGMPLRAHRRCQEPMFSISNHIAYNGQMVKVTRDVFRNIPTEESRWIDVVGVPSKEGHVIEEELIVLEDMLVRLANFTGKIYVISPFRSIARMCSDRLGKYKVACGTIHTFQGKEAEIVFLILGTHPRSVRARNWVAGSPNMLNVAVTRARERLYVIGNCKVWKAHRYFDHLALKLPVKAHVSGRLF